MPIKFICDRCGGHGEKKFKSGIKAKNYCSKECGNAAKARPGKLNSRYRITWSYEQKQVQSELVKSKVDNVYRSKAGSANRGKKFSQERIASMHNHRSRESYQHAQSIESREKIGKKSAEKFTRPGFKEKFRLSMEKLGIWIPLSNQDDYILYRKECYWVRGMWNLIIDINQLNLLSERKIFHPTKNSKGCVRDHIFTKMDGFNLGIPPEILRHPANCQIISHSENASKGSRSELSIDKLFELIQNYNNNWFEHVLVLELIQRYKEGFRWSKSEYIKQKGGDHG